MFTEKEVATHNQLRDEIERYIIYNGYAAYNAFMNFTLVLFCCFSACTISWKKFKNKQNICHQKEILTERKQSDLEWLAEPRLM